MMSDAKHLIYIFRATGLPPYGDYIGAMEVADGSRFGMPGDSERYGGP
jgi:hypothetical protein